MHNLLNNPSEKKETWKHPEVDRRDLVDGHPELLGLVDEDVGEPDVAGGVAVERDVALVGVLLGHGDVDAGVDPLDAEGRLQAEHLVGLVDGQDGGHVDGEGHVQRATVGSLKEKKIAANSFFKA